MIDRRKMAKHFIPMAMALALCGAVWGQAKKSGGDKAAPAAKKKAQSDSLPPKGNAIRPEERAELERGVAELGREIESLREVLTADEEGIVPSVQIYYNAVRYPLQYNEIIDVKKARAALAEGIKRSKELRSGHGAWTRGSGPRGYVSKIDGSVQPYLLAVPKGWTRESGKKLRVDFFCHGRGETLMELNFISGKGPESKEDRLVVHPYGRYCVANKFAGEIDTLEILESLKKQYPIDDHRIVMTGFSMGGAAVWHFAVHYADLWVAASPGAGFAETKQYQHMAESGELATVPWYQKKLWHLYDCPDWAENLAMCPTIAYAGTLDPQQQSGDIMEKAAAAEGIKLERIYGQDVGHKYEPKAKEELDRRLDAYAAKGRNDLPANVRFTTWSLRYPHMFWVHVEGLEHHWDRGQVEAEFKDGTIEAKTINIAAIRFSHPNAKSFTLDGQHLPLAAGQRAADATFIKRVETWQPGSPQGLRKKPGLQGPIDDAFMSSFLVVKPTGPAMNEKLAKWTESECDHAIRRWHGIMRGEARVKNDTDITDADIASSNLALWGDSSSNKLLAKIADKLPIKWTNDAIQIGDKTYPSATHALIAIYPNPLNLEKYVVLNSGITFREADDRTNSRQVAKLPDYAVVDLSVPPDKTAPGKIVEAGFFGESWELLMDGGRGAQ